MGCCYQIAWYYFNVYQCYSYSKLNSSIDFNGGEKNFHCRPLPWKDFDQPIGMSITNFDVQFQDPVFANSGENAHGKLIAS